MLLGICNGFTFTALKVLWAKNKVQHFHKQNCYQTDRQSNPLMAHKFIGSLTKVIHFSFRKGSYVTVPSGVFYLVCSRGTILKVGNSLV